MTHEPGDSRPSSAGDIPPRPYPPSWVNHLAAWLDRRSWPSWTFYLGLWLVLVAVQLAALWMEGVLSVGTVFPAQLFIPAMVALLLAMIQVLDAKARKALKTLRPALETTEEQAVQLRIELSTLPAWPAILASIASVGIIVLVGLWTGEHESSISVLASSPVAANFLLAVYYLGWWTFGAYLYHTLHQLRVIHRIYTKHTRVDLFALSPLYAFAPITALTALTLVVAAYGWTALNPDNLSNPLSIVVLVLITFIALAAFAWPLLGVNRLLREEKIRLLEECAQRLKDAIAELHRRWDHGELEGMDRLNDAMASLVIEKEALAAIPTWPWQPETPRLLITALALPLGLWIIQYVLQLLLET